MMRLSVMAFVLVAFGAARAKACDAVVSVAPTAVVSGGYFAPVAVNVTPSAVAVPLAVQLDAFAVQAFAPTVQVLAAPVQVRACNAPRVRAFARPARSRVLVRVR
jgi:hypothetical protein